MFITLINIMITKSNFFEISQSQIRHLKKLNEIANSATTSPFTNESNPEKSLQETRKKHVHAYIIGRHHPEI